MSATYGDLVGKAGADVHTGLLHVMRRGFVDEAQARNTVGVFYDLLDAQRAHAWRLLDPMHVHTDGLLKATRRTDEDLPSVTMRAYATLGPLRARPVWLPYPDPDFEHPWRDAADRLGAAADLLATHLGPNGRSLSEQTDLVLDPRLRAGALASLTELTAVTLSADVWIGAACRHRDIGWEQVAQWLPDRDATRTLLTHAHDLAVARADGHDLRDIAANTHPVREGDPVIELTDRMLRVRHAAWTLARTNPDYSVVTLHDLAGLGMATHLHTALAHGARLDGTDRFTTSAKAFHTLANDLSDYLAPGPPDPDLRTDILAIRQLLADLAPPMNPLRQVRVADPHTRQVLGALHGACEVSAQINQTASSVFATLARSGHVHIPTRLLNGEDLSDDPDTTAAKLTGRRLVQAPDIRIQQTTSRYRAAAAAAGVVNVYTGPGPVRAAEYDPPGLFRGADFDGRP